MGCKCKENSDKISKYTDDGKTSLEPLTGLRKACAIVFRVIILIFLLFIVIVALPFVLLYVIVVAALGGRVRINIKKTFRLNGR